MLHIVGLTGITQNPKTKDFMLIMDYANGGNLHNYLQKNFINLTWYSKLSNLLNILMGYLYFFSFRFIKKKKTKPQLV